MIIINHDYDKIFLNTTNNFIKNKYITSNIIHKNSQAIQKPYITIAIPTYKRGSLLKYAIDSAINQISPMVEYEILIVDNEPINIVGEIRIETDTEKIVNKYNDPRIIYYKNSENIGMHGNWNRCIELARGEWVAFLHDDDLLDKSYINTVTKLIDKKQQIGAILSSFTKFKDDKPYHDNSQKSLKNILKKIERNKLMKVRQRDSQIMGNIYGAPTCGNIFRREYLMNMGGFNENLFPSEDWFFLYRFSGKFNVYKTNSDFGYYRVSDNESLNPLTLIKFIHQAHQFRKYLAETTILGKVLEKVFSNERFYQTSEWVKEYDSYSQIDFNLLSSELGITYRPIMSRIFMVFQRCYWYPKRIIALLVG